MKNQFTLTAKCTLCGFENEVRYETNRKVPSTRASWQAFRITQKHISKEHKDREDSGDYPVELHIQGIPFQTVE